MNRIICIVACLLICLSAPTYGKGNKLRVVVADAYIEIHTGPGKGFPVHQVVGRGDQLEVRSRRTDWYHVRTDAGKKGWVSAEALDRTLHLDGGETEFSSPDREDFNKRNVEVGVQFGDFDGANAISIYAAWLFNDYLSAELWGTQLTGSFSSGWLANVNIVHQPFPRWFVSPYFQLGTGVIHIEPKATLVQAEDRTDQEAHVGFGLRSYVNDRFMLRAEYRSYVVFTERDSNEEVSEWKAGFAFFF